MNIQQQQELIILKARAFLITQCKECRFAHKINLSCHYNGRKVDDLDFVAALTRAAIEYPPGRNYAARMAVKVPSFIKPKSSWWMTWIEMHRPCPTRQETT